MRPAAPTILQHRYGPVGHVDVGDEDVESLLDDLPGLFTDVEDDSGYQDEDDFDEDLDRYGQDLGLSGTGSSGAGTSDAGAAVTEGKGIAKDLAEAMAAGEGKVATWHPGMAYTMHNAAEVSEVAGVGMDKAGKVLGKTDDIMQLVGLTLGAPWSWIILGSVAGISMAIALAALIKKRKVAKGALLEFAAKNGIPDTEGFVVFSLRVKDMDGPSRTLLANRLSQKLKRDPSRRKRQSISAQLRILAAFQALDASEGTASLTGAGE
jgi:hypothetical protein